MSIKKNVLTFLETSIHSPHALEPFSSNVSLAGTEKHSNTLEGKLQIIITIRI